MSALQWAAACLLAMMIVAVAPPGFALTAAEKTQLLDEANAAFDEANAATARDPALAKDLYGKAILRFERLINEGGIRNGKLHYNLANAYFFVGDLGRAMLHYRRAELYIPNDPNLRQNLEYAANRRTDQIELAPRARVLKTLFFWHYDFTSKTRAILFVVSSLLLWSCLTARLFLRLPGLHAAIAASALACAGLLASLAAEARQHARNPAGVVIAPQIDGRKGNSETYQPAFDQPLHAGTEFLLLENRGGWMHVQLFDGRQCWIPAAAAELVATEDR